MADHFSCKYISTLSYTCPILHATLLTLACQLYQPTCNSLHEMDVSLLLNNSAFSLVSSKGHWRNAWKVDVAIAEANGNVNVNSSHWNTRAEKSHDKMVNKHTVLKSLK